MRTYSKKLKYNLIADEPISIWRSLKKEINTKYTSPFPDPEQNPHHAGNHNNFSCRIEKQLFTPFINLSTPHSDPKAPHIPATLLSSKLLPGLKISETPSTEEFFFFLKRRVFTTFLFFYFLTSIHMEAAI